jgi:hypothetical protein
MELRLTGFWLIAKPEDDTKQSPRLRHFTLRYQKQNSNSFAAAEKDS